MRNPLITTMAALAMSVALAAQASEGPAPETPRVDARQARQQDRIQQGVDSGALTAHERHRLQHQQDRIRHAERHAKADGTVSASERQRLERLQDRSSRSIYRQKHDRQTHDRQTRGQRAG